MVPKIAYLVHGRVKLAGGGEPPLELESQFGEKVKERARSMDRRHGWKNAGRGASFVGGAQLWGSGAPTRTRARSRST